VASTQRAYPIEVRLIHPSPGLRGKDGVAAVVGHQASVRAGFDDPAVIEDDDRIGVAHCGEAVGDCDGGAALARTSNAHHLHIAARPATEVVDALESRGLVRRLPDPVDRRAAGVEPVTPRL
jgi:hypothetical protein